MLQANLDKPETAKLFNDPRNENFVKVLMLLSEMTSAERNAACKAIIPILENEIQQSFQRQNNLDLFN